MRKSNVCFVARNLLYGRNSTLQEFFFDCCRIYFKIIIHEEVYLGIRDSQQRGLFINAERTSVVPANTPIATIPLANIYTANNIDTKPNTLHHISLKDVTNHIPISEFKMMAPQLHLGLQFAAMIDALPDLAKVEGSAELRKVTAIQQRNALPWARALDDEDFNEEFIWNMYGAALDSWQRASYEEMTKHFHKCISTLHRELKLPFKPEHFRRITRLVLARAEHVPRLSSFSGYYYPLRKLRRVLNRWVRQPESLFDVAMVPLLDMVNHSNRPNCAIRIGPSPSLPNNEPAITLHTIAAVQPGGELCRHYNFALNRGNALFRYGFLPFDLLTMVEIDQAKELYFKQRGWFDSEEDAKLKATAKQEAEVHRLENIFQAARKASEGKRKLQQQQLKQQLQWRQAHSSLPKHKE